MLSEITDSIPLVIIPVYLDEGVTGVLLDSQSKNVDIETKVETLPDGTTPKTTQRGLNSSVTINLVARKDSVGLAIFSAFFDQIFSKVTSQEYRVSYIGSAMSVFGGLVSSYSVNEDATSNRINISVTLVKGNSETASSQPEQKVPQVAGTQTESLRTPPAPPAGG